MTVLRSILTAVCASSLPFADARLPKLISAFAKAIPSKCADTPSVTAPLTCQKTFLGSAPPVRITFVEAAVVSAPAICNIQTSFGPPDSVTLVPDGNVTAVPHV